MPSYEYPRPALTADVAAVVAGPVPRVLLIRRGNEPFAGRWALPGGFVDEDETPEAAARREFAEEAGLEYPGDVELLGVYGEKGRDPRGWTVSAVYLARYDAEVGARAGDDAADARWFGADELPELAFDHDRIVADAFRVIGAICLGGEDEHEQG